MKNFEVYLKAQGMKSSTVIQHCKYAGQFLSWLAKESLMLSQVSYTEILDYTDHLKREAGSVGYVNRNLLSVQYYFSCLKSKGLTVFNPVAGIRLKGTVRTIPHHLLERAELEELQDKYEVKDDRTHRNKVMLGLLVFQGLSRLELETLRPEHLKLREGKIQVPQTGKNNGRTLALQPGQILDLQEYLLIIRPKLQRSSERLFTGRNDIESLKNSLLHLNYALKKINPKYQNVMQIRQSVITEWLKEKDLRTVQYMAGHKYVSSTECYQITNLEDLKEALNKHHPLNK